MLKLLDRWLLGRFTRTFLTFTSAVVGVFLIVDAFTNLDDLTEPGLLQGLWERYGPAVPELLFVLSPFLGLISALWVVANLQRQNELVPLLAAGVDPRRVAAPLVLTGLVLAPLAYLDREYVLPRVAPLRRQTRTSSREHEFPRPIPDEDDGVLVVGSLRARQGRLDEVRYTRLDPQGRQALAAYADEAYPVAAGPGGAPGWQLYRGVRITVPRGDGEEEVAVIDSSTGWFLPSRITMRDVEAAIERPAYLSARQIRDQLRRTPGFRHLEVQLYERYTAPLASLVLLALGVPLALRARGGWDTLMRYMICLGFSLAYFVASSLSRELGAREVLGPRTAAFLPVLVFGAVGALLALRDPDRAG